jgi:two-component sensor histidine kinase
LQLPERLASIRLEAEPVWLPTKAATALALIVNELVSNAVKHGQFGSGGEPPGPEDYISVRLLRRDGDIVVVVEDCGPGFPSGFHPSVHAHLGLDVVWSLVKNDLQGEVTFTNVGPNSRCGNRPGRTGGRVEVVFPERLLTA